LGSARRLSTLDPCSILVTGQLISKSLPDWWLLFLLLLNSFCVARTAGYNLVGANHEVMVWISHGDYIKKQGFQDRDDWVYSWQ